MIQAQGTSHSLDYLRGVNIQDDTKITVLIESLCVITWHDEELPPSEQSEYQPYLYADRC